ncbi:MAG TPA: LysR substrate-binding domain-containing protein [Caulobacteraceae bacterium]|jgi:DNA-binding transcriptional LysR family regulator
MFEKLTSQARAAPSLNALRAFEAMGRTGRATLAAEELCVTHSAVSRQVKALERSLGVQLFAGPRHDLRLTAEGRDLLAGLTPGFDAIDLAALKAQSQGRSVIVAANPSVCVKWLVPRLAGFAARHPSLKVELVELATHALTHRGAHVTLRLVQSQQMDRGDITAIMPNFVGPVTAPSAHAGAATTRLISRTHPHGWRRWAELTATVLPPATERQLPHLHVALEAAIAGLGVAVLAWPLVADDMRAGRLVPAGPFAPEGGALALISDPRAETVAVRAFKRWIVEEGAAFPAPPVWPAAA